MTIARGASTVIREPFHDWGEALRLDNLDTEVVIVPAHGRIVRYGPTEGGPNFLWQNPRLLRSVSRDRRAPRRPDWIDYGGDRGWLWPQSRWSQVMRRDWPPPEELERRPHEARPISRHVIELSSQPLPRFGLRVVRTIALAPHDTRLIITTTLDPLAPRRSRGPRVTRPSTSLWTAWSISQIPTPTRLAVRIDPKTDLPGGHKLLLNQPWETVRRVGDDILLARCPTAHAAKFGADGDLVVAEIGDWLFVQKRINQPDDNENGHSSTAGRYFAGEAVQVFATGTAADPAPGMDYCQIEFTGPRGQSKPAVTVQWDLIPWNPTTTDNELAALVRTL